VDLARQGVLEVLAELKTLAPSQSATAPRAADVARGEALSTGTTASGPIGPAMVNRPDLRRTAHARDVSAFGNSRLVDRHGLVEQRQSTMPSSLIYLN
jgi:hypothetical protein